MEDTALQLNIQDNEFDIEPMTSGGNDWMQTALSPIIQDVPDGDVPGFEEAKADSAKGPKIKNSSGDLKSAS